MNKAKQKLPHYPFRRYTYLEKKKYTARKLYEFINGEQREQPTCIMFEGKLYKGVKCQAKSFSGVRFNRLIRLCRRLNIHY